MFARAARLEKAFRRHPRVPLFARLADHHLKKGRRLRARVLCEEGCERFPEYPTGLFLLGRCYEEEGLWEEARRALVGGLRLDPDSPAAYRRLSRVHRELGNPLLALKCLEQAAALDPLSQSLAAELRVAAAALGQTDGDDAAEYDLPGAAESGPADGPQTAVGPTGSEPPAPVDAEIGLFDDVAAAASSVTSRPQDAAPENEVPGGAASPPGATEPEADEPEAIEPEAIEPEAIEPEATEPEATEPEAAEPEAAEPEAAEPEATEPEAVEPEATEPEAVEPETDEPETDDDVAANGAVTAQATEDEAAAEPFAHVQPLPSWTAAAEAEDEDTGSMAPAAEPAEPAAPEADENDEGEPWHLGASEVAALGEGLFDDLDDVPASDASAPVASETPPPARPARSGDGAARPRSGEEPEEPAEPPSAARAAGPADDGVEPPAPGQTISAAPVSPVAPAAPSVASLESDDAGAEDSGVEVDDGEPVDASGDPIADLGAEADFAVETDGPPPTAGDDASADEDKADDRVPEALGTVSRLGVRGGAELAELLRDLGDDADDATEDEPTEPVPTVTLAKLYAGQGFADRATQIYQLVLDADPGNEAARMGLDTLRGR